MATNNQNDLWLFTGDLIKIKLNNSFPTSALPVSGSEGLISARCIKAPLLMRQK